jgi:hypothetical protein
MEDEFPPLPLTAVELAKRWLERDLRYEKNVRMPLPESVVKVVRSQRAMESMMLIDRRERGRMWSKAGRWTQPVHDDFGSLKDWLDD